jgi:hypothetical protein
MRRLFWIFLILFLPLAGCVTTNYYAELNREFSGQKYQRVLIQFLNLEPGFAQYGEQATRKEIQLVYGKNIQCYLVSDVFYTGQTTRSQIKAEVQQFEQDAKIDATLICASHQGIKKETNVLYSSGMPIYANNDQKNIEYRMELFDTRTGKSVWYSTAHMEGNSFFNSFQGMMSDFIHKSISDIKANGLLGEDDRPEIQLPAQGNDKNQSDI